MAQSTRARALPAPPATAELPNVGENLRLLRQERGLTLQELAERTGVSKAMLNQIETGKSSPTIALGWKIANGLQVSFGALLGEAEPGDFVVHRRDQVTSFYSENRALCSRALFPPGDTRAVELYELTLVPGGEERASGHVIGTREQIYLVSGQLTIETGGRSAQLEAGDVIFFRADRVHRYHNPGRQPARFILVMRYPPGQEAEKKGPAPAHRQATRRR
jgi:transcriptional regulator with XRE-family HTH domain